MTIVLSFEFKQVLFLIASLVYMTSKTREIALDGTGPHLTNSTQLGFSKAPPKVSSQAQGSTHTHCKYCAM